MSAYILLLSSSTEKQSQLAGPGVLGPFANTTAAKAWAAEHSAALDLWLEGEEGAYGGYPNWVIIGQETATDPTEWVIAETLEAVEGFAAGTAAGMAAEIPERP